MKTILTAGVFALFLTAAVSAQNEMPKKGIDTMPGKKAEQTKEHKHGDENDGRDHSKKATEEDKVAEIPTKGVLKRGAPLGNSKKVSLAKVLANPTKYAGQTMRVEGVITRACKKEGCWMQLAPTATGKSVMIKFKDHQFFVPLKSAGAMAKVEGMLEVKTLSKEEVDHLVNDDGAKFDKINADGTVTEVGFTAFGVELTAPKK